MEPASKIDALRILADLGVDSIDQNRIYPNLAKAATLDYQKAISGIIERLTGISIKQFVKLLRPICSGIVIINEREILAEAEVPKLVNPLLIRLNSGH